MKNFFAATMSAALLAGLGGSVIAYRSASAEPLSPPAETSLTTPAPTPVANETAVQRWAPCTAPATLEKGVCVTDVVKTVTLPDDSTSGDDAGAAATVPDASKSGTETEGPTTSDDDVDGDDAQDDQQVDHEDDADDDHADDDHADDDHADDDHADDDHADDGEDDGEDD